MSSSVHRIAACLIALSLAQVSTAFAFDENGSTQTIDESGEDSSSQSSDTTKVQYKKRTSIHFGDQKVTGEVAGPAGAFTIARSEQSFNPLIRLRRNFNIEIEASVLQIR